MSDDELRDKEPELEPAQPAPPEPEEAPGEEELDEPELDVDLDDEEVDLDEEPEAPSPPPHGQIPPEEPPAEEAAPRREVSVADLDMWDTLRFMAGLLGQHAWVDLGLVVAPGASEPRVDLVQARVAIDTLEFIARQLAPHAEPGEIRELERMLSDLRINYVKKAG